MAPSPNTSPPTTVPNTSHILSLPNNRQLHYAFTTSPALTDPPPPPTPPTLILFFPGYLSIGTAPTLLPAPLLSLSSPCTSSSSSSTTNTTPQPIHYLAPTLPGNGASSPPAAAQTYQASLLTDLDALLTALYPSGPESVHRIFVAGGSYGSVAAQMVYGHSTPQAAGEAGDTSGNGSGSAPWRWGRKVAGLQLLAPFSPFRLHAGYAREMTWANWISVGPVAKWVPFGLVPWLVSFGAARMVRDVSTAEGFMRGFMLGRMGEEEREMCERWCSQRGVTKEEWVRGMAEGAVACVSGREGGWRGFLDGPGVLHSDWGFDPRELDGEWGRSVLVVVGDEDDLGLGMGEWLGQSYRGAGLKVIRGGHVAALWHTDEIWREMLDIARVP